MRNGRTLNKRNVMKKTVIRKIYRAVMYKGLSVQVVIGKDTRLLSFMHAGPTSGQTAYLITDDPEIQEALEHSSGYGKDFYLERQMNHVKEVPDIPKPIVQNVYVNEDGLNAGDTEIKKPENTDNMDSKPSPDGQEQTQDGSRNAYPDVTNAQSAKIVMLGLFPEENTRLAEMRKADEIRQFANEKGVVFPNWL